MPRSVRLVGLALSLLVGGTACHPGACWFPKPYPADPPAEVTSTSGTFPAAAVDVAFDSLGVPHVWAESEVDLAFAQGFLHGRDRAAQLALRKAFAWGRLTELFGPDFLESDRMSRLYTWGIDEEMEAIEDNGDVMALLRAYTEGINLGAEEAGQPLELLLAGLSQGELAGHAFEPWVPEDVVAFNRALSGLLVAGFPEELARTRIAARVTPGGPLEAELLEPMGSLGAPVVSAEENTGQTAVDPGVTTTSAPAPRPRPRLPKDHPSAGERPRVTGRLARILGLVKGPMGSNAWAVRPEHTASGVALLAHDPHLTHDAPSTVYLMHLEAPGFLAAGATMPGVPGVIIGHGRDVAWGIPVSNSDGQDLVRIQPYDGRDDLYLLDAEPVPYETHRQVYRLGPGPDAPSVTETWRSTVFGPLLPPGFGHLVDEGELYALQWIAFAALPEPDGTPPHHRGTLAFWDLARAHDVDQAEAAIDLMMTNTSSFVLADTAGHIAYRASGLLPVRKSDEPAGWPRDGRFSSAGWAARLPGPLRPQLDDPASGIIVAANQRIVEAGGPRDEIIGQEANLPYRAARIRERLEEMTAAGPVDADALLRLQQDVLSVEARLLAPAFAAACPGEVPGHDDELVAAACAMLDAFDARFTVDSGAAVIFRRLERVVRRRALTAHLGEEVAAQVQGHHFVRYNVHRRILEEHEGTETALFDDPDTADREGLAGFMRASLAEVLDGVVADPALGPDPEQWRWGAVHTITLRGALAEVPLLGGAFVTAPRPQAGCGTCVRAEAGEVSSVDPASGEAPLNPDAVFAGAVLRMIAEMSDPPRVRIVIDAGQSGHLGHPQFDDQVPLWASGQPFVLARERGQVEAEASQRVRLLPP